MITVVQIKCPNILISRDLVIIFVVALMCFRTSESNKIKLFWQNIYMRQWQLHYLAAVNLLPDMNSAQGVWIMTILVLGLDI